MRKLRYCQGLCANLILVSGIREYLAHGFQHPQALVADDEFYAIQAAPTEPPEEAAPAGLVLFHAFGSAQNLAKTVLIYGDCHQNGYIFVLSAPVAVEVPRKMSIALLVFRQTQNVQIELLESP